MKQINFILTTVVLIFVALFTSCSNDDDNFIDPTAELPEAVKTDFYERYNSNIVLKRASINDKEIAIYLENSNKTAVGLAHYLDDAWVFTSIEYSNMSQLPQNVVQAFNRNYFSISNLNITEVDIKGFDQKYYNFSFTKDTLDVKNWYYEVLINSEGNYLEVRHNTSNRLYYLYSLCVNGGITYLNDKFSEAKIRAIQDQGGQYVYNILDRGVTKFVTFRSNNYDNKDLTWIDTRYDINISDVPSYVFEELEQREPLIELSRVCRVESVENMDGTYFLIWVGDLFNSTGYSVKQK